MLAAVRMILPFSVAMMARRRCKGHPEAEVLVAMGPGDSYRGRCNSQNGSSNCGTVYVSVLSNRASAQHDAALTAFFRCRCVDVWRTYTHEIGTTHDRSHQGSP